MLLNIIDTLKNKNTQIISSFQNLFPNLYTQEATLWICFYLVISIFLPKVVEKKYFLFIFFLPQIYNHFTDLPLQLKKSLIITLLNVNLEFKKKLIYLLTYIV